MRNAITQLQNGDEKEQTEKKNAAAAILRRLEAADDDEDTNGTGSRRRLGAESLDLNRYEQMIATEVVAPEDIPVTFEGMSSSRTY